MKLETARRLLEATNPVNCGFVREEIVLALAQDEDTRLLSLIVRCGSGRITCACQDVAHFVGIIEREGTDYVRDVAIPAESTTWGRASTAAAIAIRNHAEGLKVRRIDPDTIDYGGAFAGVTVTSDADPGL